MNSEKRMEGKLTKRIKYIGEYREGTEDIKGDRCRYNRWTGKAENITADRMGQDI